MTQKPTCGDFNGINAHGRPCKKPAGYGRPSKTGLCMHHYGTQPRKKSAGAMKLVALPPRNDRDSDEIVITKPQFLDAVARDEFDKVVAALRERKLLHTLDNAYLVHVALAYSFSLQAGKKLQEEGLTYIDMSHGDGGAERKHPAFQIWRDCVNQLRSLGSEFGYSPNIRAALGWDDFADDDDLAALL